MEGSLVIRRLLVDGHDYRLGAHFLTFGQRLTIGLDVTACVELVPERSLRRLGNSGKREARRVTHDHRRIRRCRRSVHAELAVRMEVPLT